MDENDDSRVFTFKESKNVREAVISAPLTLFLDLEVLLLGNQVFKECKKLRTYLQETISKHNVIDGFVSKEKWLRAKQEAQTEEREPEPESKVTDDQHAANLGLVFGSPQPCPGVRNTAESAPAAVADWHHADSSLIRVSTAHSVRQGHLPSTNGAVWAVAGGVAVLLLWVVALVRRFCGGVFQGLRESIATAG